MKKNFLSWCFCLLFCPGVLIAQDSSPDYTSYLSSINSSVFNIDVWSNYIFNEVWKQNDLIGSQILPIIGEIFNYETRYLPNLEFIYEQDDSFYQSFNADVKPAILEIEKSNADIADYTEHIDENLLKLYDITSPFYSKVLENFIEQVSFDNRQLLVEDYYLRNRMDELLNINSSIDEGIWDCAETLDWIASNKGVSLNWYSDVNDALEHIVNLLADGASNNSPIETLQEWGYEDIGKKLSQYDISDYGNQLDFSIPIYEETSPFIHTNMTTKTLGFQVDDKDFMRSIADFLMVIAKSSESSAMSGQLNYLINYKNLSDRKDTEKEKQEYEDKIAELEEQVDELEDSFESLKEFVDYLQSNDEKKQAFDKVYDELNNIHQINNELPEYIKLGQFPASWGNIAAGGDLIINIVPFHPFFNACNSVFAFIYYSLISLFIIWLFSKVPSLLKYINDMFKNIMTWK